MAKSLLLVAALGAIPGPVVHAQSLRGSTASLDRQNRIARQHDYTYLDTAARVRYFADKGWLIRIRPTADFAMHAVSFPYARPEVELFIQRLAAQYRQACGEQLVVTSLTRPTTRQPRNASDRSVHPTGMALDLRYSRDRNCRRWLEGVLVELERAGLLEATLERRPVHYHVALFPQQYGTYVETLAMRQASAEPESRAYTVRSGDSLWSIARSLGTTVGEIRTVNAIDGSRIFPGQVLSVPESR
jgi:hypothetical protein